MIFRQIDLPQLLGKHHKPATSQGEVVPDGCEFLLVFDDGDFEENDTFLITDWFRHTPSEVLGP
jgi:hypothetical protein